MSGHKTVPSNNGRAVSAERMFESEIKSWPSNQKSNLIIGLEDHDTFELLRHPNQRFSGMITSVISQGAEPGSTLSLWSIVKMVLMWLSFRFSSEAGTFLILHPVRTPAVKFPFLLNETSQSAAVTSYQLTSAPSRQPGCHSAGSLQTKRALTICLSVYNCDYHSPPWLSESWQGQRQAFTLLIQKFVVCSRWRQWVSTSDLTHGSPVERPHVTNCMWLTDSGHLLTIIWNLKT